MLSRNLEKTLHRALRLASERRHEYATLEHLLLALTEDQDAVPVLTACGVDLRQLQQELTNFMDTDLQGLRASADTDPKPTAGFQKVVQRSVIHVQASGREEVTGANVLLALFSERDSPAVDLLRKQEMTRLDAVNYIAHGISKQTHREKQRESKTAIQPPPIPEQGIGPHFSLSDDGIIDILRIHNNETYDHTIINALLPRLKAIASRLLSGLGNSNAFQPIISDVEDYLACLDNDPSHIPYAELWVLGLLIQKHLEASRRDINDRLLPPLEDAQQSAMDSLVALHGPFILSTETGQQLFDAAQRYNRSRQEEQEYRDLALLLSNAVATSKDLVSARAKKNILRVNHDIGSSSHPEREMITSETMNRNFLATVGALAIFAVGFTVNSAAGGLIKEIVCDTAVGREIISFGVTNLDKATFLAKAAVSFLLNNFNIINGLAILCSDSFGWLGHLLNWLKAKTL